MTEAKHQMADPRKWMKDTTLSIHGSLAEFGTYCQGPDIREIASQGLENQDPSFYGHMKHSEAALRCATGQGDEKGADTIRAFLDKFNIDELLTSSVDVWAPSIVGAVPIVPNAIMGVPDAMLARNTIRETQRGPVTVIYERSASAAVEQKDLEQYGAAICALVLLLQRIRPVELWIGSSAQAGYGHNKTSVTAVKLGSSPFDPAQLAMGLSNVSVYRRLFFSNQYLLSPARKDTGRIGWGWSLYGDSPERTARLAHCIGASDDPAHTLVFSGVRLDDMQEVKKDPVAWLQKQLQTLNPELFSEVDQ